MLNCLRSRCSGEGDNIKVYVRVRPPAKNLESDVDNSPCLEVTSGTSLVLQSKPDPKTFSFDHVANVNTTQVCCTFTVFCVITVYCNSVIKVIFQKLWLLFDCSE